MRRRTCIFILALAAAATPVSAQDEEPERWRMTAGLALNSSGGNQRLTVLTTTLGFTHLETERYELGLNNRFRYGRSEGEDVAQNFRSVLNFDLFPNDPWSPFAFATLEQDPFRKLELRVNGGAGVKYTFWRQDWSEVSLSSAVLYSMENLEVPVDQGDGVTENARLSFRGRVRRTLGDRSRVEQVVFYQPVYDQAEDYLFDSTTSLTVGLTETVGLSASYIFERDNTPPVDVLKDDWALTVGLEVATGW